MPYNGPWPGEPGFKDRQTHPLSRARLQQAYDEIEAERDHYKNLIKDHCEFCQYYLGEDFEGGVECEHEWGKCKCLTPHLTEESKWKLAKKYEKNG
jgi:hypothetical protein